MPGSPAGEKEVTGLQGSDPPGVGVFTSARILGIVRWFACRRAALLLVCWPPVIEIVGMPRQRIVVAVVGREMHEVSIIMSRRLITMGRWFAGRQG